MWQPLFILKYGVIWGNISLFAVKLQPRVVLMEKIRIVLFKGKKMSEGRYPVKIYYYNGKQNYVGCGVAVRPDQWKKDGDFGSVANHPKTAYLNSLITKSFNDVREVLKDGPLPVNVSLAEVAQGIDFYQFGEAIAKEFDKQNKFSQATCYRAMLKSLEDCEGPLELRSVSISIIENYRGYLTQLGRSKNTIRNYTGLILSVVSKAVERRVISREDNHVSEYKLGAPTKGFKVKLTHEDLNKIKKLKLPVNTMWIARAAFLIEYYLQGRRIGEIMHLKKTDIIEGVAQITIKKNEKITAVPIPAQVKPTIDTLMEMPGVYLLPYLNGYEDKPAKIVHGRIRNCRGYINDHLKNIAKHCDIDKHITTHVGRHTFSKHYYDQTKDMRGLQGKLVHGRIGTTEVYMEDMKEVILDPGTKAVFDR